MTTKELEIKEGTFTATIREVDEKLSQFNNFISYSGKLIPIQVVIEKGKFDDLNEEQLFNMNADGFIMTDYRARDLRNTLRRLF